MKSKAPLTLVEQIVMVLIFAIAAAICLEAFVFSHKYSGNLDEKAAALNEASNAAEILKSCGGDFSAAAEAYGGTAEAGVWQLSYDSAWHPSGEAYYCLTAIAAEEETPYLGSAGISVTRSGGEICSLRVCWQEEEADE